MHKVFLEHDYFSLEWAVRYGVVRKEAVAADDFDLYSLQEEIKEQKIYIWIVFLQF
jgi:hypothetical protein